MNSSRIRPGASTNAILRLPNIGPETISGSHTTDFVELTVDVVAEECHVEKPLVGNIDVSPRA